MFNKIILKIQTAFVPCSENNYRPKFLEGRFLFHYLLFLVFLKLTLIFSLFYLPQSVFFADISSSNLVQMLNQERESLGLNSLAENDQLEKAAFLKAQDMLQKDYFSHQSPEGKSPWYWIKATDYNYQYAGENLAIGFLDSQEVYQEWKNSPSHNANLFNPNYKEIGIAVLKGDFQGNETFVVVQLFGSPKATRVSEEKPIAEEKTPVAEKPKPTQEKATTAAPEVAGKAVSQFYISSYEEQKEKSKLGFNFLQFLSFGYNNFIQKLIFYSLLFIMAVLIINIFVRIDIQYEDLILKALACIALLVLFNFIDKELMIRFIPHNFYIN